MSAHAWPDDGRQTLSNGWLAPVFAATMNPPVLLTLALLAFSLPGIYMWRIVDNYLAARSIGIPVVVVPGDPTSPFWVLFQKKVVPHLMRWLPFARRYLRFWSQPWGFELKSQPHLEYGTAFIIVTPDKNWMYIADDEGLVNLFQAERRGEFGRAVELLAPLEVFGPSISTAQGDDWQRMRKSTAASFNENTNKLVWADALRQAQDMLKYWQSLGSEGVRTTGPDVRTLALNVLLSAAFGKYYPYVPPSQDTERSRKGAITYRTALENIMHYTIFILALGTKGLGRFAFLSKTVDMLHKSTIAFKDYMAEMYDGYRPEEDKTTGGHNTLLASLVRASKDDKLLSRDEVFSNLFVYTFAGHDTTASAMLYTMYFLAVHPEVQEWMAEELDYVLQEKDPRKWGYEEFPRLKRTLAVLFETIRLCHPLSGIIKATPRDRPGHLTFSSEIKSTKGRTVCIPPRTRVLVNVFGVHTLPKYWGDDALEWRPQRWIKTTPASPSAAGGSSSVFDREYMMTPQKGTFYGWSDAMQTCPGKKFSYAEHVAVMAALFKAHVVVPVKKTPGESGAEVKTRVMDVLNDSEITLLLGISNPEKVALEWKDRT